MIKKRFVSVSDTDFTKCLYFTSVLKYVQESLEQHLKKEYRAALGQILEQKLLLPVVHSKADYLYPIFLFDEIIIETKLIFHNTSFEVIGKIFKDEKMHAKVTIIHVCIDKKSGRKINCKDVFHEFLES